MVYICTYSFSHHREWPLTSPDGYPRFYYHLYLSPLGYCCLPLRFLQPFLLYWDYWHRRKICITWDAHFQTSGKWDSTSNTCRSTSYQYVRDWHGQWSLRPEEYSLHKLSASDSGFLSYNPGRTRNNMSLRRGTKSHIQSEWQWQQRLLICHPHGQSLCA